MKSFRKGDGRITNKSAIPNLVPVPMPEQNDSLNYYSDMSVSEEMTLWRYSYDKISE